MGNETRPVGPCAFLGKQIRQANIRQRNDAIRQWFNNERSTADTIPVVVRSSTSFSDGK